MSIPAELVAFKAAGAGAHIVAVDLAERAIDPVCGMSVEVSHARFVSRHDDQDVYFCAAGCQRSFDADPRSFTLA